MLSALIVFLDFLFLHIRGFMNYKAVLSVLIIFCAICVEASQLSSRPSVKKPVTNKAIPVETISLQAAKSMMCHLQGARRYADYLLALRQRDETLDGDDIEELTVTLSPNDRKDASGPYPFKRLGVTCGTHLSNAPWNNRCIRYCMAVTNWWRGIPMVSKSHLASYNFVLHQFLRGQSASDVNNCLDIENTTFSRDRGFVFPGKEFTGVLIITYTVSAFRKYCDAVQAVYEKGK